MTKSVIVHAKDLALCVHDDNEILEMVPSNNYKPNQMWFGDHQKPGNKKVTPIRSINLKKD